MKSTLKCPGSCSKAKRDVFNCFCFCDDSMFLLWKWNVDWFHSFYGDVGIQNEKNVMDSDFVIWRTDLARAMQPDFKTRFYQSPTLPLASYTIQARLSSMSSLHLRYWSATHQHTHINKYISLNILFEMETNIN